MAATTIMPLTTAANAASANSGNYVGLAVIERGQRNWEPRERRLERREPRTERQLRRERRQARTERQLRRERREARAERRERRLERQLRRERRQARAERRRNKFRNRHIGHHAPPPHHYAKRKKKKKIGKYIAIGAGILALGIIAASVAEKDRRR